MYNGYKEPFAQEKLLTRTVKCCRIFGIFEITSKFISYQQLTFELCLTVSIFNIGLLVLGVRVSRGGSERVLQRGALLLQGTQARKDDIYKPLYVKTNFFTNALYIF
jgi:hypothetical protein